LPRHKCSCVEEVERFPRWISESENLLRPTQTKRTKRVGRKRPTNLSIIKKKIFQLYVHIELALSGRSIAKSIGDLSDPGWSWTRGQDVDENFEACSCQAGDRGSEELAIYNEKSAHGVGHIGNCRPAC